MTEIDLEKTLNEEIMQKLITFALNSVGNHKPNPPVAAALRFPDGKVLFDCHRKCGEAHAEVNVVKLAESQGYDVSTAVLYVTLEPCCFQGRTPACTDLVLKKKIKKLVFGCLDPNPKVAGKGIETLKKAGLDILGPVCKEWSELLISAFTSRISSSQKIFTVLKQATSLDGCIATAKGDSKWISNEAARDLVHRYRAIFDAVLTTARTVKADNARLTLRSRGELGLDPLQNMRIVLDRNSELNASDDFFQSDPGSAIHIKGGKEAKRYERAGVKVIELETFRFSWPVISEILLEHDIRSLWVEAGGNFSDFLLENGAFDYYFDFKAGKILSGTGNLQNFYSNKVTERIEDATRLSLVGTQELPSDTVLSIWKRI